MNSKITIELGAASWMDTDVLKMMVSDSVKKLVEDFNKQNVRSVTVENVSYDHSALHQTNAEVKPLKFQLEEQANELFPENIVKKKDKSKPLKKAYIDGGLAAQDILGKAYAAGIQPEDLF